VKNSKSASRSMGGNPSRGTNLVHLIQRVSLTLIGDKILSRFWG
jgi:hypothetical protein